MIRVMSEADLREAKGDLFWKPIGGGLSRDQNRFELEYGYYVVDCQPAGNGRGDRAAFHILAPGPYVDHYSAEHAAVTRHGMEPADGAATDDQEGMPW